MANDSWEQIRKIFDEALRRKPEERLGFVREACGENKTLRAEVESLLSSLDSSENFLETPVVAKIADVLIVDETKKLKRGENVGHYEIVEQIGEGGMGEIFLAKDANLNRKVALKLLASHITEDKNRINRFRQEAFATSALNHPNIVTIYEIGAWQNRDFIVAEFIDGMTLRDLLQKKRLSAGEALNTALQIASALAAAHGAGIVHRDIKPENIMIRPDGLVKILDFGIAKYRPSEDGRQALVETEVGEIIGTVAYMSPEQARGQEVDGRTDVWSLGVIFYEMLAGKLPFQGETKSDRIAAILEHDPAPIMKTNHKVSPQLQQIVSRALAKNKKDRYAKMTDMAEDLYRLSETTSDRFPALFILPPRKTLGFQRSYLFAISSLIVFFVGAILLGYYISGSGKTNVGDKKSVLVLPLKPINTSSRDELYEVGIADSLIQRIGLIRGFVVRPLSEIRRYADIEQDPLAAGREQRVDYVLAANYQIAGGRIRVTAQLLNVANGQVEESYKSEKDASDVFAMQDAVGEEVGELLQSRFAATSETLATKRGTENEEAYRLYLQAQYLLEKGGAANAKRAIELFDQALALDSNYAAAWAGKARAHFYFPLVGGTAHEEEYALAKSALERALALDNNLPEAYAIRGVILNDYEWDFAAAENQFSRAIELSPDSSLAYRWSARRLAGQGRYDEAVARIKTAIDLNPSSVTEQIVYGRILYFARRCDEAVAQLQRVVEIDAAQAEPYAYLWRCHQIKGDERQAYENFIKFHRSVGTSDEILKKYQTAYAGGGWRAALQTALNVRRTELTNGNAAYDAAVLSALLNESDQAFRYLDEALKMRSTNISNLRGDPGLDSLRGDPRFEELVRQAEFKPSQ